MLETVSGDLGLCGEYREVKKLLKSSGTTKRGICTHLGRVVSRKRRQSKCTLIEERTCLDGISRRNEVSC